MNILDAVDTLLFLMSLSLKIFTVYFALVAVFALRPRKSYPRSAPATRFAVVVAARNEETVIGDLVHSVLTQNYPPELRQIYVVPNNCTDFTEAAAVAAGAKILHCLGNVKGKGDALHQALAQLWRRDDFDAVLVLDADNTLAPDYLARMNDAFAAGAMVCKSRTRAANPTASGVAGCYGLYNTIFDLIWNRPRMACGLSAKLIGTGFAFRREALDRLGGWNTATIAEDAEFAAQCAGAGIRVWWVPDAVNYDEEPMDFRLSLRQRKRWCSGVMQVAKKEIPALWRRPAADSMLRWDISMFLTAPFAQAASGLLLVLSVLAAAVSGDMSVLLWAAASLIAGWLGSMALAAVLCLLGGYGLRGMANTILVFPIFMASWMPLQIISLFRDTTCWHAVAHQGRAVAGSRV